MCGVRKELELLFEMFIRLLSHKRQQDLLPLLSALQLLHKRFLMYELFSIILLGRKKLQTLPDKPVHHLPQQLHL
jgi:hypothetical protein